MPSPRLGGRRGAFTAAATACAAAGSVLIALGLPTPQPPPPPAPTTPAPAAAPSPPGPHWRPLPRSEPSRIRVPALGLSTPVEPVGLDADDSIALPRDPAHAGWFTHSPTPGESGNVLLVGHLDSATGPAAFYGLGALRPGDRIVIDRHDGQPAAYAVTQTGVHPKNAVPATVYAPTTAPRLTLITCADWDPSRRAYRANLVLTASPVP
ncbi:class F sortase [Streptomyces sp. JJ66]|uniref:class F sortase n=1 Tax=Streptomyces sp. JJ66 TaxID=2803843 RepID=UPI001C5A1EEC|nr:class F sortase [Streptomyces sp. JJ66]MBW1600982.1 class F sortase [Streptomyces sp. JJ66]